MRVSQDDAEDVALVKVLLHVRVWVDVLVAVLIQEVCEVIVVEVQKFVQVGFPRLRRCAGAETVDQVNGGSGSSRQLHVHYFDIRGLTLGIVSEKS